MNKVSLLAFCAVSLLAFSAAPARASGESGYTTVVVEHNHQIVKIGFCSIFVYEEAFGPSSTEIKCWGKEYSENDNAGARPKLKGISSSFDDKGAPKGYQCAIIAGTHNQDRICFDFNGIVEPVENDTPE